MIEYALNAKPRHGVRRSVISQLQICSGPVASSTGARLPVLFAKRSARPGAALIVDRSLYPPPEHREPSITPHPISIERIVH